MTSPATAAPTSPLPITSAPSTPRRSRSPITDGRFDLTPRSKIRALLAQFDSDDEGGGNGGGRGGEGEGDVKMGGGDDEDEDEDEVVGAGRRRQRRMGVTGEMGGNGDMEVDGEGEGESEDGEARKRIGWGRIRKAGSPKSKTTKSRRDPFSQNEEGEESDSDIAPPLRPKSPEDGESDNAEENDPPFPNAPTDDTFDDDLPSNLLTNPRFAALVSKKRKELKEKEAAEAAKAAARHAFAELENDNDNDDNDDGSDDSEGRALQSSIPPRQKRAAGKKAMEEMARETARLARGMQLAHEARTRRKIGKEELFKKFGFRQPKGQAGGEDEKAKQVEVKTVGKVEERSTEGKDQEGVDKEVKTNAAQDILNAFSVDIDDLPPSTTTHTEPRESEEDTPPSPPAPRLDKGKGRAIDPPTPPMKPKSEFKLPLVKVDFSKHLIKIDSGGEDSDIEIVDPTKLSAQAKAKSDEDAQRNSKYAALQARKLAILEVQQKEKKARELAKKEATIRDLKKRSGITRDLVKSPNKQTKQKMNPKILAAELIQKSRQQALQDREEKIAELKAKGVVILTKEEMLQAADTVEEQMEKVRLEAERIKKREKKQARLEAIKRGEVMLDEDSEEEEYEKVRESEDDDEEDGDWAEEEGQEGLYELSGEEEEDILGSGEEEGEEEDEEDEENEEEDEEMEEGNVQARSSFIDDEAGEDDEEEDEREEQEDDIDSTTAAPKIRKSRRNPSRIVEDDDDDAENQTSASKNLDSMDLDPVSPTKPKNPFAAFSGFTDDAPMGLTQMFQGTIADSGSPKLKSKNPFAAFPDLDVDGVPLGLTQMFNGTLADEDGSQEVGEAFSLSGGAKGKSVNGWDGLRKAPVNALENSQAPRAFSVGDDRDEEVVRETQLEHDADADTDVDMQVDLAYNQSQTPPRLSDSDDDPDDDNEPQKQNSLVDLGYSQSQIHTEEDSYNIAGAYPSTQSQSQWPNPTPDRGFGYTDSGEGIGVKRFETPRPTPTQRMDMQTQSTVPDPTQLMSPLAMTKKKGRRLRRVSEKERGSDDENVEEERESSADEQPNNAFTVMKKASKSLKQKVAQEAFNKKLSEAKKLVHDQAEESEDEYAGLGGADDPDSDADSETSETLKRELADLIDDKTGLNLTKERSKLEALYAEQEREQDAKNVTRLFKDLQNGGLRRKRSGWDVSDDEEDEAERRRAVRRRNEARLRRLLEKDDEVRQIAENPKRKAFLKCLQEEVGDDEDGGRGFLDGVDDEEEIDTPMEGVPEKEKEVVQPRVVARLQREDSVMDAGSDSDAFTKGPKLPKARVKRREEGGLKEVRSQLAFLVEDDERVWDGWSDEEDIFDQVDGSNTIAATARDITTTTTTTTAGTSEGEVSVGVGVGTRPNPRRTNRAPVIDRILLKRTSTLESTTTTASTTTITTTNSTSNQKLAFHNPSTSDADPAIFRAPGLLRRATANANSSFETDTAADGSAVKKSGAKGSSSISYQTTSSERAGGERRKFGTAAGAEGEGLREQERRRVEMLRRRRRGGMGGGDGVWKVGGWE